MLGRYKVTIQLALEQRYTVNICKNRFDLAPLHKPICGFSLFNMKPDSTYHRQNSLSFHQVSNLQVLVTKTKSIHPHIQISAYIKELQVLKLGNTDDVTKKSGVAYQIYTWHNFLFTEQHFL
jgi:hypothetical protein